MSDGSVGRDRLCAKPERYSLSLMFRAEGVDDLILDHFGIEADAPELSGWEAMVRRAEQANETVRIALVGKYAGLKECYKSLAESLVHGGIDHETRVNIQWIESEEIERQGTERILREVDGILVPGGFGARGIEGGEIIRSPRVQGLVAVWPPHP